MSKYSRILFFAAAFLLIWTFLMPKQNENGADAVVLDAKSKTTIGKVVTVTVINNSEKDLTIPANCPHPPFTVAYYSNGEWSVMDASSESCPDETLTIASKKKKEISLAPWTLELFNEQGRYRLSLEQVIEGKDKTYTREIEVTSPGFFTTLWRETLYKPIFNTLIFLISIIPGHSLGWAIILLTFLIKLILLVPNQKALKAQKAMQKVQPQLDALKKKYKNDQQKLAEETMKIWQKHKVNPMSSCLPMVVQFPVLIALFYVVKNGLDFINPEMLYGSLKNFDASLIQPIFLGLIDLTKVNAIVLPIIIGLLQFGQMRLTLGKNINSTPSDSPVPNMGKTMMYIMPVMIAFFTASLPAAVGFYWGASTLFGIGQQFMVNRSKD